MFRIATWNVHGRTLAHVSAWPSATLHDVDVLVLQEVAGLQHLEVTGPSDGLQRVELTEDLDLGACLVFGARDMENHLSQVLVVDPLHVQSVTSTVKGRWSIAATLLLSSGRELRIIGSHFPHSWHNDPEDSNFHVALSEFGAMLHRSSHLPTVAMGDYNVDVAREDGERCIGFNLHVGMLGFRVLCPPGSTYKCKSYDFMVVNDQFMSLAWAGGGLVKLDIDYEAKVALPSDHHVVKLDAFLRCLSSRSHRRNRVRGRVGKWLINESRLTQEIRSGRYGYNGNELQSESDIDRSCSRSVDWCLFVRPR